MAFKGGPAVKAPALHKMSPAELIDQLASPERWVRQQAKECLYRLPTDAVVRAADARLAAILAGEKPPGTAESDVKFAGLPADADMQAEHVLYELIGVFCRARGGSAGARPASARLAGAAAAGLRHAHDRAVGRSAARPLGAAGGGWSATSRLACGWKRWSRPAMCGRHRRSKWPRWCLPSHAIGSSTTR